MVLRKRGCAVFGSGSAAALRTGVCPDETIFIAAKPLRNYGNTLAKIAESAAIRPEGGCLSSVDHGCFVSFGTTRFGLRRRNATGNILINGFRAMTRMLGLSTSPGGCGASA